MVDWFRTLDDYKHTTKFEDDFGRHATFSGLLVVGRATGLTGSDRARLRWRAGKVLVDSRSISCVTFDDLHDTLRSRIGLHPLVPPAG